MLHSYLFIVSSSANNNSFNETLMSLYPSVSSFTSVFVILTSIAKVLAISLST